MIILPAIDLKEGNCVRLFKGDFATTHKVAEGAYETAISFKECGAEEIHVVDLDGALKGRQNNYLSISQILKSGLKMELGGGIRTMENVDSAIKMGVNRVVLGSAAMKNKPLVMEAVAKYGAQIAVGIDARDGFVSTEGWLEKSQINYIDFAKEMVQIGVQTIIFTDIERDGTLSSPNFSQLARLKDGVSCNIIASGGVKDINDIRELKKMELYGVIAGKAIYSKTLSLKEAIEVSKC